MKVVLIDDGRIEEKIPAARADISDDSIEIVQDLGGETKEFDGTSSYDRVVVTEFVGGDE